VTAVFGLAQFVRRSLDVVNAYGLGYHGEPIAARGESNSLPSRISHRPQRRRCRQDRMAPGSRCCAADANATEQLTVWAAMTDANRGERLLLVYLPGSHVRAGWALCIPLPPTNLEPVAVVQQKHSDASTSMSGVCSNTGKRGDIIVHTI